MKKTKTTIFRFGRLHMHILPVLVWLGAVACVVMLFRHRTQIETDMIVVEDLSLEVKIAQDLLKQNAIA
jgi:hypothetical protein